MLRQSDKPADVGHTNLENAMGEMLDNLTSGNDEDVKRASYMISHLIRGDSEDEIKDEKHKTISALQNKRKTFIEKRGTMMVNTNSSQQYYHFLHTIRK